MRSPGYFVRKLGERILYRLDVLFAQLLSELCSSYRTDFNALAAGHALVVIYVCSVC